MPAAEPDRASPIQKAACRSMGTKHCAPICLSHLSVIAPGRMPGGKGGGGTIRLLPANDHGDQLARSRISRQGEPCDPAQDTGYP